ncbi:MAG: GTP cyclohydrolase I, partial [Burkholderiales bacterium]|nr:GTP cyclohydrolase I [Burkholderiales bacterium]
MPQAAHPPAADTARIFRSEEELARLPASERIRYRLVAAERRYHANDNISAFVQAGELEELKAEVEARMQA